MGCLKQWVVAEEYSTSIKVENERSIPKEEQSLSSRLATSSRASGLNNAAAALRTPSFSIAARAGR